MQYNPALDGLRAVAVLAVVAFHCRLPFTGGGSIGVDLFFVLSGYLITSILRSEVTETGTVSLGRFYWRRALRLWPPLLLMLAAYAAVAPVLFPARDAVIDTALAATYLTDYAMAFWHEPLMLGHTWSLSVEEHFYLLWPLVILATRSLSQRALAIVLAVAFITATAWRIADAMIWQDWYRTYYRFDTRMSGLMLGGLIAAAPWRPKPETAGLVGRVAAYVLIVGLLVSPFRSPQFIAWGGIIVDLAAGGLILSVISTEGTRLHRLLTLRPLVYLGVISYSVYLWHYPLSRLLRYELPSGITFVVVAGFAIIVAALSYEFIEKPLKSMRRRPAPEGAI
ncbi:acyltransferase family protein [Sinorhizobium fredii]|uniref:acyltransferase family protein n=1 Tax=Rhizobium fredii TaxID=380 RepID=UPI0004AFA016|nr:acyltransferase [Sinorhizobium fredii]ASY68911.1 acyltransferase family protein [Sinorhizobium fredii CCBAU 83666]